MKRNIQRSEEKDILRWGYGEKVIFTTKEAYNIIVKEHMVKDNLWSKVWDPTNWPKVSTFLWLLCHTKFSLGTISGKGTIMGPQFSQIADKRRRL